MRPQIARAASAMHDTYGLQPKSLVHGIAGCVLRVGQATLQYCDEYLVVRFYCGLQLALACLGEVACA